MIIRDDSDQLEGLGQYQPDLPYAAPQPGGGATESSNLYPWMKQYGYPDVENAPASLWTNYPARGMPSSPGETDEWAPLPAQGSAYAGKGVTMPDVATHGLGAGRGQPEEVALRIAGAVGAGIHGLFLWYFLRTARYERKWFLRWLGYLGAAGSGLSVLSSLYLMAGPRTYSNSLRYRSNLRYAASQGGESWPADLTPAQAFAVDLTTKDIFQGERNAERDA